MRVDALRDHLPALWAEGEVVGGFLGVAGTQLDMLDEALLQIQRGHWFDVTPDFDEAVALAALLNIGPEDFHADIGEFRAWVHALTNSRLHAGAVTRDALRILVETYRQGFQRAADIDLVPAIAEWASDAGEGRAALVENPARLRSARLPVTGGWEPLARLRTVNAGLDPAEVAIVVTGHAAGTEYAPFIANRTTGHALVYRGAVEVGSRLVIAPQPDDRTQLSAHLDGVDVTDRLDVYPDLLTGPDGPGERATDRPAPRLARGENEWWFLPLAHFDTPGLDRFLLAFADDALRTGRFDKTVFDDSIFALTPEVSAWVAWLEHEPASLRVDLPARTMRTEPGELADALAARDRLRAGLEAAVDSTAAAGVVTEVRLAPFVERQPSQVHLRGRLPQTIRVLGATGADRLGNGEGRFDLSDFDDAVLR